MLFYLLVVCVSEDTKDEVKRQTLKILVLARLLLLNSMPLYLKERRSHVPAACSARCTAKNEEKVEVRR